MICHFQFPRIPSKKRKLQRIKTKHSKQNKTNNNPVWNGINRSKKRGIITVTMYIENLQTGRGKRSSVKFVEGGEGGEEAGSFEAEADDALEEVEDVAGIAGFFAPGVGVVGDAAGFVGGDGVALHDPFDGGFAVDDVIVGFQGDVAEGDGVVVDDGAFLAFFRESHFADAVVFANAVFGDGVGFDGFVVEVPLCQFPPGGAEFLEMTGKGDARQFFFQVVGKAGAVFRGMQQAVDVVEDVFFADTTVVVGRPELFQGKIGDAIVADVVALPLFLPKIKHAGGGFFLFVPVQGEALTFRDDLKVRDNRRNKT